MRYEGGHARQYPSQDGIAPNRRQTQKLINECPCRYFAHENFVPHVLGGLKLRKIATTSTINIIQHL